MCVESLTVSIAPGCEGLKKLGGIAPNFYVGAIQDVSSITYDATDGFPTALTFASSKVLIKVTAKQNKHSYTEPIQDEGEGNMPLFQQTFTAKVYHSTQAERNAIQDIVGLDRAFVIYEGRDGQFYVVGLTNGNYNHLDWGCKVTAGDDTSGVNLNDENAQTLTFTANMPHKALIFDEDATTAENRTVLEGYLTNP